MNKKNKVFYYVGIFLNGKLLFVTSVNYSNNYCKLKKNEYACNLGYQKAKELAFKLKSKGVDAYLIADFEDMKLRNN